MSETQRPVFKRSSLACLSCRSRHQKCDAKKPQCSRCCEADQQCLYTKSRRGANGATSTKEEQNRGKEGSEFLLDFRKYTANLFTSPKVDVLAPVGFSAHIHAPTFELCAGTFNVGHAANLCGINETKLQYGRPKSDFLVEAYYRNFHKFHPFILPRRYLITLSDDPNWREKFRPLLAVVRLIGNLYFSQQWSTELQRHAEAGMDQSPMRDPIRVQCHLLYSAALFWRDQKSKSQIEMAKAVDIALQLKMFEKDFALQQCGGDTILAESWRRTWWMVYVFDAFYAGTLGTLEYSVMHIDGTVDLPCEESQYESGIIPETRSLREWDCRELGGENKPFSSFAYLIGAVRCVTLAKASAFRAGSQRQSSDTLQDADSILDSWMILVPKVKKQIMLRNGDTDELMFQAHLLIHVVTMGLHRPLSGLNFNAVEHISSCASEPTPGVPTAEHIDVHTARVLRSAESQIALLSLPSRRFNHTPFLTCMISEGTLALLSACKFLLRGTELAIARDQIRLSIGCLKEIGALWPRSSRNVSQIQTIARHVLDIEFDTPNTDIVDFAHSRNSTREMQESSMMTQGSSGSDIFSHLLYDDISWWYDIGGLDPASQWWTPNQDCSANPNMEIEASQNIDSTTFID